MKYKKELSDRNKAETGIRYEWYALQRWGANYSEDFFRPKIVYNDIAQSLTFGFVEPGIFFNNTVYFINASENDIKFLLGILNNSVFNWYYKNMSVQLGKKAVRMFSIYMEKLPLPILNERTRELYESVIKSTEHILNKQGNIEEEENRIKMQLYKLYKFSSAEIGIIEDSDPLL